MRIRLSQAFIENMIEQAQKTPYSPIPADGSYMERFWVVPYDRQSQTGEDEGVGPLEFRQRPLSRILQIADLSARVHHIKRSDSARAFHDHPWDYCSVILRGGYREYFPVFENGVFIGEDFNYYESGEVLFRKAKSMHRIELEPGYGAWTLFICGPECNDWGFFPIKEYEGREYMLSKVLARNYSEDRWESQ